MVVTFLDDAQGELNSLLRTYTIVSLLSLVAITAIAAWQSGRLLAPLRSLNDTAREISATDLSRRLPETGNDDITALTRTFNEMLDRLEAAFTGQRQFLDDAGHELRTPLTVLAGHLELLDVRNPDEVASTRALLADEVDRMSRLVGDLILLAKAGRPGFITPHPVDLDELTSSVLAKARALGDRTWESDGVGVVTLMADQQRLTQALLQLAENAVKHTGPGDVVAIGSAYDGTTATLWVRDTGPGVDPADRAQIFERSAGPRCPSTTTASGSGCRSSAPSPRRTAGRWRSPTPPPAPGSRSPCRPTRSTRGPHPDRGGRGADRRLRRQGTQGGGPRGDRGRRRPHAAWTRR